MALVRRGYSGEGEGVPRAQPKSESDAGKAKGDIKYEGAEHWRSVYDVGRRSGRGEGEAGDGTRAVMRGEGDTMKHRHSANKERKERQQVAEASGADLVYMAAAEIKTRPREREGED